MSIYKNKMRLLKPFLSKRISNKVCCVLNLKTIKHFNTNCIYSFLTVPQLLGNFFTVVSFSY